MAEHPAETVPALLERRIASTPDLPAVGRRLALGNWTQTTWRELQREVHQAAAAFQQLGLRSGDRLAVMARTCREWQVTELAALSLGAVIVGIDAHATEAQIAYVLNDAHAAALVADTQATLDKTPAALRASLHFRILLTESRGPRGAGLQPASPPNHPPPEAPATATTPGLPEDTTSWSQLATLTAPSPSPSLPSPASDSPATLIYTSGTTGNPKGILYTHRQLVVACEAIAAAFPQLQPGDSMLCWLPMAHLFQRMMNLVAVQRGVITWFVEDPRQIMDCAREVRPSVLIAVPRFYEKLHEGIVGKIAATSGLPRRLAEAALRTGADWACHQRAGKQPSLGLRLRHAVLDRLVLRKIRAVVGGRIRFMITGSAPTPAWLLEFFHGLGLLVLEAYGLSENTVPMAANRPDAWRFGSVGKPFPQNEIRFAADGEILVRGPGLFSGYLGDASASNRFTADGFYQSGDIGQLDTDGFLYLTGRKAEIIKTSTGRRLAPGPIEMVYAASPYVDQVMVVGNGRKTLAGLVTLNQAAIAAELKRRGQALPAPESLATVPAVTQLVLAELQNRGTALAPHERASAFALLSEPFSITGGELTSNLKLRRGEIEKKYADTIARLYAEPPATPATPVTDTSNQSARVP